MDEKDFIVFLIVTTITFSYVLFDKKRFVKLWNKCKTSIESYYSDHSKPIRISLLESRKWEYRGEGNEYLAIALPEEKKILRLRKAPCPLGFSERVKDWYIHYIQTDLEELKAMNFEKLNLEYYKVLVNLIGDSYVQPSDDVLLIPDEINKINKMIALKRPEYRKQKQIAYACGSILTDYAYLPNNWKFVNFTGPTFAVEIKPKQGWIPESERNFHLCTYCLNQYNKFSNGDISSISDYCPLDLFSGETFRMKFAIKRLLNNPQNNLKIFKEGILVYGENAENDLEKVLCGIFRRNFYESIDEFCDLVSKALLKQLYTVSCKNCTIIAHKISNKKTFSSRGKVCNWTRYELPQGCVLDRILNLQELDLWGTKTVYEHLNQQPNSYKQNKYGHAVNIVNKSKNFPANCPQCFFTKFNLDNMQLVIERYLMSAIAKDCSLMITFREISDFNKNIPRNNILDSSTKCYAFNIGVFDLYPKPLTCILKHMRKKNKLIQIYNNFTNLNGHVKCCTK